MDIGASELAIDGYTGDRVLARGGFSTVYLARQDRLDRVVAVKVLSSQLTDPTEIRRFETECKVMGRLSTHPHIADVYDAGITGHGRAFIVMKYYSGGTTAQRVQRDGPLTADELMDVATKIGGALQFLHDNGVIHRDIKPENILLDDSGEPMLSDFGVAAVAGPDGSLTTSIAFSRSYVAPEVLDLNEYGVASDIYSLGASLYTLATGRPVFSATSEARLILAVLDQDPEPLDLPGLPQHVADAILRCLRKNPTDRFASVRALLSTLRNDAAATGSAGSQPSVPSSKTRPAAEGSFVNDDQTVARVSKQRLPAASPTIAPVHLAEPTTAAASPTSRGTRSRSRVVGAVAVAVLGVGALGALGIAAGLGSGDSNGGGASFSSTVTAALSVPYMTDASGRTCARSALTEARQATGSSDGSHFTVTYRHVDDPSAITAGWDTVREKCQKFLAAWLGSDAVAVETLRSGDSTLMRVFERRADSWIGRSFSTRASVVVEITTDPLPTRAAAKAQLSRVEDAGAAFAVESHAR